MSCRPAAYRERIPALVRAGHSPKEMANELEPSEQTIRKLGYQDSADRGKRPEALTTAERAELLRLRRENRQLKVARDILGKRRSGSRGSRGEPTRVFEFVSTKQAVAPVATRCQVLGVSRRLTYGL